MAMFCVRERTNTSFRASAQATDHPYSMGISPGTSLGAHYPESEENGRKEVGSAPAEGSGLCTTGLKYLLGTWYIPTAGFHVLWLPGSPRASLCQLHMSSF